MDSQVEQVVGTTASTPVGAEHEVAPQTPSTAVEPGTEQQPDPRDAELERLRTEAAQMRTTLNQVDQWAQQLNQQQQLSQEEAMFKQREQKILDRAEDMSPVDAQQFIRDEMSMLAEDRVKAERARAQAMQQQWEARTRELAKPQWVNQLMQQHHLPESYRDYLSSVDPNYAQDAARLLAEQHKNNETLQQQIEQLSRTQQAGVMQSTGMGNMGGVSPANAVDMPTDPDEKAMHIYRQLMGNRR